MTDEEIETLKKLSRQHMHEIWEIAKTGVFIWGRTKLSYLNIRKSTLETADFQAQNAIFGIKKGPIRNMVLLKLA